MDEGSHSFTPRTGVSQSISNSIIIERNNCSRTWIDKSTNGEALTATIDESNHFEQPLADWVPLQQ